MRWSRVLLIIVIALAVGALMAFDVSAPHETRYYIRVVLILLGAIVVDVLVTYLFVLPFVPLMGLAGRPAMNRSYVVFLGWNLLRSHRSVPHLRHRFVGGARRWLERGPDGIGAAIRQAIVSLVVVGGLCYLGIGIGVPPQHWWAPLAVTVGFGLMVVAVVFLIRAVVALRVHQGRMRELSADHPFVPWMRSRNAVTSSTYIAIVSVGVGVSTLIITLSTMSGFKEFLRSKILHNTDQLLVRQEDEGRFIEEYHDLADQLRGLPEVKAAYPYMEGEVIVSSPANISTSVRIRGMDVRDLDESGRLEGLMVTGRTEYLTRPHHLLSDRVPPDPAELGPSQVDAKQTEASETEEDPSGIDEPKTREDIPSFVMYRRLYPALLIGEQLANSLQAEVGAEIQIISPEGDVGPLGVQPRTRTFRVGGTFHTGLPEYDLKLAYMELSEAQRFFDTGGLVNRIEVRADAPAGETDAAMAAVQKALAGRDLTVLDWKALNRNLFSALKIEKVVMFLILGVVLLVAAFAIVAALVMTILQKSRQIATLKALGATNRGVLKTFLVVGGFIGCIGTVVGLALGLGACGFMKMFGVPLPPEYYIKVLPVNVDPFEVFLIAVAALGTCLVATLYPAFAAARLEPVEALRYD